MSEAINPAEIFEELKEIKKEINHIKKHMIDIDMVLTSEEDFRLKEALKEYKEGKATKLEDFEKELED